MLSSQRLWPISWSRWVAFMISLLRQIRGRHWSNLLFTGSNGQVVRQHIDKHQGDHQQHHDPDSPISMRVLPYVVARVSVVPWLGSLVLDSVFVRAHFVPFIRTHPCAWDCASLLRAPGFAPTGLVPTYRARIQRAGSCSQGSDPR